MHDLTSDTPCSFTKDLDDQDSSELANLVTGPGVGMDEDLSIELIENTTTHDVVKFWPWVNQVPFYLYCDFSSCNWNTNTDAVVSLPWASTRNCHAIVQKNGVSLLTFPQK